MDASFDAILTVDADGAVMSLNPAAERLFGYPPGEVIGTDVQRLLSETGAGRQVMGLRKDGSSFIVEQASSDWWADAERFRTLVIRDVSDRVRAEDLQSLLLGELNHRVKNSLATVRALVAQTLRGATDLEAARTTLDERLLALARAHDVLTREKWEGAGLADIIAAAIEASGAPGRFSIDSADLRLPPRLALAMSMTLHELCTNAVKYGALSQGGGVVAIQISRDDAAIRLVWRERGGPAVAPPTRRGFGSRMIERLVGDVQGMARLDFEPAGLVCTITAPIAWRGLD